MTSTTETKKPAASLSFEQALTKVRELSQEPSNQDMLYLYARFKQITEGRNTKARPWTFDLRSCAKWDAWYALRDRTDTQNLKKEYIQRVQELVQRDGK